MTRLVEVLVRVPWPSYLFLLISAASLPIYFLVLIVVFKKRKRIERFRSTYYNLVICQGCVDIFSMLLYLTTYIPRAFRIFPEFYWENREFMAPFSFNHSMFFLILRCYEDALMAIQRFYVICRAVSTNPSTLQKIRLPAVMAISWLPPLLISLPIVIHWPQTFDSFEGLNMLTPADHQKFCDIYQIVFQLITFTVSLLAYYKVLRAIFRTTSTKRFSREIRLSFVAMGQVVGFLMVVIYHILQYIVVHYEMKDAVRDIRTYFPIITGFESYINPWLHLTLNKDLRLEIIALFSQGQAKINQMRRSESRRENLNFDGGKPRRHSREQLNVSASK